jgi:hypothetical protein
MIKAFKYSDSISNSYSPKGYITTYSDTGYYIDTEDILVDGILTRNSMITLKNFL